MENIDGYEQLQKIGAQKLHEDTHIPKEHARGLIEADFSNMNKIQFVGFISILEREYGIDLERLKEKGLAYFEENQQDFTIAKKLFIPKSKKKSFTKLYIVAAVAIFLAVLFFNYNPSEEIVAPAVKVDNANIQKATTAIAPKIEQVMLDEAEKEEEKRLSATLKILPKDLLWVGYIDLETGKKRQKTFTDELDLDPHKHWLLTLGHGNVDFEINGEIISYQTPKNLRFEYKDGRLRKIYAEEFTRLNKGEKW